MAAIKTNRSIHAYLTEEEYERIDRAINGMRTVGKRQARINKGDVAAALIMVAIDDISVLTKARHLLTDTEGE